MAILGIARMGHPVLRRLADPAADPTDPSVARLIRDMAETLDDAGGVGLAAPQVHERVRVILVRPPGEAPAFTVINPVVTPLDDDRELGWEGCLSIPGLRGVVPRHRRILCHGVAPDGRHVVHDVEGFVARIVQHEVDHLDGVLYIDRMVDLRDLVFEDQMRHHTGQDRPKTPEGVGDPES